MYYISPGTKLGDHIDEFNKFILDLANIDIEIEDEDQVLMLLTSLPLFYENFVETLLHGRESLTMEDVQETLNSMKLKKRTEGTKEETGDGLYVRRDCSMKKSSGFVKKGILLMTKVTPREALVVVENDKMTELVMDSNGFLTVLVITTSLERLFIVPRLSHESTSSLKELLEVSYRHGVLFVFT
ncbi:hypothetical protein Tco_1497340, partial [Tanacetum coccineum]